MARAKKKAKAKAKKAPVKVLRATPRIKAAARKSAARAAKGAPIKRRSGVAPKSPAKGGEGLTLHGFFASLPSGRVGLMLAMSGVPWAYRHVDLGKGAHKAPEYLAKNRFGQVPVLQDGGVFLAQSNSILQYLAEKLGAFAGRTPAEKMRVAEWLCWADDRLPAVGQMRMAVSFPSFLSHPEAVAAVMRPRAEAAMDFLDRHLGGSKFVAGAYPTIADISVFPFVATAHEGGLDPARWGNIGAWAERLMKLPGAAHPYEIMPKTDRAAA